MKKKGFLIIIFALLFFLFPLRAKAISPDDFREYTSSDSLYSALPEGLEEGEVRGLTEEQNPSHFFSKALEMIRDYLFLEIGSALKFFSGLCSLILFSALFESTKKSFGAKLDGAFDFLFLLVLAYYTYRFFSGTVETVKASLDAANTFLLSSLSVLTLLLSVSGAVNSAAVQGANLSFVITLVSTFLKTFLFPLFRTLFCFSFLEGAGQENCAGVVQLVRKTARTLCVFFFMLTSAILSLQNALAASADSLAMRSIRFAAGNFIPVVGSLLGESTKTLAASFQVVKTECGAVCLVGLIFILLRPILYLLVQKTALSLAVCVSEVVGEVRCRKFLSSLSKTLDLMQALLISHSVYLVFAITLFIRTRGNLS